MNENKKGIKELKFPIAPMHLDGEIKLVPIKNIQSGINEEKSIKIPEAVVAYLDVLGFSNKTDQDEIDATLVDFPGPLILASRNYPNVRFNVFSDNAFVATPLENAKDLISVLRFAFKQWCADGILVRGGISMGSYKETHTIGLEIAPKDNFIGSLFSGSAVTSAVRLEKDKLGALLFTDEEFAKFFSKIYGEPIFKLENDIVIGWSDDTFVLCNFAGLSLFRLIKFLELNYKKYKGIETKLLNNIRYSLFSLKSDDSHYVIWSLILAILSLPHINQNAKKRLTKMLKIKDSYYKKLDMFIKIWLRKKDDLRFIEAIANMDSSIPTKS